LRFPLQVALSLHARLALLAGQLFLAARLEVGLLIFSRYCSLIVNSNVLEVFVFVAIDMEVEDLKGLIFS
jgi:hypothetical protein